MIIRENISLLARVDGTSIRNHVSWFDGVSKFGSCFLLTTRMSNCSVYDISMNRLTWLNPPLEPLNSAIAQTGFDRSVNGLFYTSVSGSFSAFDASLNLYNFGNGESGKIVQVSGPPAQPMTFAYGSASHLLVVLKVPAMDSKTFDLAVFSAYSGSVVGRAKGYSPFYTAQQFLVRPLIDDGASDQGTKLLTIVADSTGQFQLYQLANARSGSFAFQTMFALGQNSSHYQVFSASVKPAKRHLFVAYANIFGNMLIAYDLDLKREIQRYPNLSNAPFALEEF